MTTWTRTSALALALAACTSAPAPVEVDDPAWERLADAPTPRLEVAVALDDGALVVAGGLDSSGTATDLVEYYDIQTDAWGALEPLPAPVHHAMAVTYRGDVVVLGGFDGSSFSRARTSVWALRADRWVELPGMRRARAAGAAVVIDDRIIVFGGRGDGEHHGPVEIFDGTRWRDGARIPTLRDHLAGATDGRYAYAVAGRLGGIDATVDIVERYDPTADRWERLADAPTARGGIGAAVVGEELFVLGGEGSDAGDSGVFDAVEVYSIAQDRWRRSGSMERPRHGLGVVARGRHIYAVVGGPTIGGSVSVVLDRLRLNPG